MEAPLALARKLLTLTADGRDAHSEPLAQFAASLGPEAQATLNGLLLALKGPLPLQRSAACQRDPLPHELVQLLMRPELELPRPHAW